MSRKRAEKKEIKKQAKDPKPAIRKNDTKKAEVKLKQIPITEFTAKAEKADEKKILNLIEDVKQDLKSDSLKEASDKFRKAINQISKLSGEKKVTEKPREVIPRLSVDEKEIRIVIEDMPRLNVDEKEIRTSVVDIPRLGVEEKEIRKIIDDIPQVTLERKNKPFGFKESFFLFFSRRDRTVSLKETYFPLFTQKSRKIVKNPIFLAILINLIIRIPRVPHAIGDDAFVVVWMAKAIHKQLLPAWIITPLSYFGLYPFSNYPIGGPFILSIILIFFSEDLSIFIFSFLFMGVSIITCYYLAKLIFRQNQTSIFLFVMFFATSPIFFRFTYWTCSVRGPFLALLPLLLYSILKLFNDFNSKNFALFCISLFLTSLMHGLTVIIFPLFFLSASIALLFSRYTIFHRIHPYIYIPVYICVCILGIMIFPIDPDKTAEFLISNETFIGKIWNLFVDYTLRIGLIIPLAILGFLVQSRTVEQRENNLNDIMEEATNESEGRHSNGSIDKEKYLFYSTTFLILGTFLFFVYPISTYTSLLFLPFCAYYAVLGTQFLLKWRIKILTYSIGFLPLIFSIFYSINVITLPFHQIGTFILFLFSFGIYFIIKYKIDYKKKLKIEFISINAVICISIILFALISLDGVYEYNAGSEYPLAYLSDDEIRVAQYLKEYNLEEKIVVVYNPSVARRMQALCFQPFLYPFNEGADVYYGWISDDEIINRTELSIYNVFTSATPFQFIGEDPEHELLNPVLSLNVSESSGMEAIISYGIGFIVTENVIKPLFRTTYGNYEVSLLSSIVDAGILRLETEYLRLYEIPS
ncbi:MAG: hypothetical protein ACFFB5_07355 [Promethearchaeota archaeon]